MGRRRRTLLCALLSGVKSYHVTGSLCRGAEPPCSWARFKRPRPRPAQRHPGDACGASPCSPPMEHRARRGPGSGGGTARWRCSGPRGWVTHLHGAGGARGGVQNSGGSRVSCDQEGACLQTLWVFRSLLESPEKRKIQSLSHIYFNHGVVSLCV